MKVKSIKYNWHQVGSLSDRDGAGENYEFAAVGEKDICAIDENLDGTYVVRFDNGIARRVFNPNVVEYFPDEPTGSSHAEGGRDFQFPTCFHTADVAVYCCVKNAILMIRKPKATDPKWNFPGGFMNPNEVSRQTASRELLEETGIAVSPESLCSVGEYVIPDPRFQDGPHGITTHLYLALVNSESISPKLGDDLEGGDFMWVPADASALAVTAAKHVNIMQATLDFIKSDEIVILFRNFVSDISSSVDKGINFIKSVIDKAKKS